MNGSPDVKSIFGEAVELTDPVARDAYLAEKCGANASLRAEVESLLAAFDQAQAFLAPSDGSMVPRGDQRRMEDIAIGSVIAGKYKLMEKIGEGGMGSVYMAQQTEPVKRAVAVKVIKAGMDSKAVLARFDAERQALAMMDHPNIARVLDAGATESGRPFFVMELVKGTPITNYCDARKLTTRQRLELFVPVCQAIQHAHQKGIIHRDIKPSNVLVALYDDRPVPKVIDFGVAKAAGQQLTDLSLMTGYGAVIGSPEYMSPEQASFNQVDVDTRSDVYSLGVVLYELLTGTTPVDRNSLGQAALLEVLRIVREVEAPRPSAKLSTLDTLPSVAANRGVEPAKISKLFRGELDWVLLKALEKDRARRYDSANGLARDIERYLADEVVEARPPSAGYRLRKFVRRHKGQVIATGVVALTLVLGMVGTAWQAKRASDQRDVAIAATEGEARQRKAADDERDRAIAAKEGEARQRKAAVAQRDKAMIIAASMKAMLRAAGPSVARGRDSTMLKEMMDRSAELIESGELKNFPEAELYLRDTIGNTYLDLALVPESARMFESAVAKARTLHSGDHIDTATALDNLAKLVHVRGGTASAEPLARESLEMRKRLFQGDHKEISTGLTNLADILRQRGDLAGAESLFREALEMDKRLFKGDSQTVAKALDNLAKVLLSLGRSAEAEPLMKDALEMRRRLYMGDHPDLAIGLNNLAAVLRERRDLAGAEMFARESVEMKKRLLSGDHPDVLAGEANLAGIYWSQQKFDQSIPLFEKVLAAQEKRLGRQHADTLLTIANLGVNYKDAGRLAEAIPLLEEGYRAGKRDSSLRFVSAQLLDAYSKRGNTNNPADRAKTLASVHEILNDARRALPKASDERATLLSAGGTVFLACQAWDEAEPILRECLAIREKAAPDDWRTFNTKSLLGGALLGKKKYAEAEPLLLKGYEGMKQRKDKIAPQGKNRLPEAAKRLVELYEAMEKKDEAAKWQAEWEAAKKFSELVPVPP